MARNQPAPTPSNAETLFAAAAGLWLGLALIKFGNPAILQEKVDAPKDILELVLAPWPVKWGYWLLGGLALAGIAFARRKPDAPRWLVLLPAVWLVWQVIAGLQTVDVALTRLTVGHFISCVAAFYLGLMALSQIPRLRLFWLGLLGGFLVVLAVGFDQHWGGLAETREYFYRTVPDWQKYPPEFLKKLASDRIYSTLFYPNTLAGVIILVLPVLLALAWQVAESLRGKLILVALLGLPSLACLYWSGSKAGWLLTLVLGVIAVAHWPMSRRVRIMAASAIAIMGLGGFALVYSNYLQRGASSVFARMDCWRAGWTMLQERPVFGSGPGTFEVGYRRLKPPEAEMARLAHNDYLQQGTDSGVVGMGLYGVFTAGALVLLYRRSKGDSVRFAVWLGVTGLALQGLVEFGLYIPAMAWTGFLLMGWLMGLPVARNPENSLEKPSTRPIPGRNLPTQ